MEGIIVDEYTDKKKCKLLVINEDGSRELYEPSPTGFVKIADFPNTTGYTGKIKLEEESLTFKNGLLIKVSKEGL